MSRNPATCPHNLIEYDKDTDEYYCEECGDTVDKPDGYEYGEIEITAPN